MLGKDQNIPQWFEGKLVETPRSWNIQAAVGPKVNCMLKSFTITNISASTHQPYLPILPSGWEGRKASQWRHRLWAGPDPPASQETLQRKPRGLASSWAGCLDRFHWEKSDSTTPQTGMEPQNHWVLRGTCPSTGQWSQVLWCSMLVCGGVNPGWHKSEFELRIIEFGFKHMSEKHPTMQPHMQRNICVFLEELSINVWWCPQLDLNSFQHILRKNLVVYAFGGHCMHIQPSC